MDSLNDKMNENITFFFEDLVSDVTEDNGLELEKMMLEFQTEEYNMNTNDNTYGNDNNNLISSSELSYFIKKDFYCGNIEFYYNEEYKLKGLMKICQYYGMTKGLKTLKKQDIIASIIYFENIPENYEIVEKRHKMWAYMTELLEDPKMKLYLLS
jgi:hypothetical protein